MTKNEIAWAAVAFRQARLNRPNTDVHILMRDITPIEVELSFDDKKTIIDAARLGNVSGTNG